MKKTIISLVLILAFTGIYTQPIHDKENKYKKMWDSYRKTCLELKDYAIIDCEKASKYTEDFIQDYYTLENDSLKVFYLTHIGGRCENVIQFLKDVILNETNVEVRSQALKNLGNIGAYSTTSFLIEYSKNERLSDKELLRIGITLVALNETEKSVELLNKICYNCTDEMDIIDCMTQYYYMNIPDTKNYLVYLLQSNYDNVAGGAVRMLAELGEYEVAFPILKERLHNPSKYARAGAITGLASIGNRESLDLIYKMLQDKEEYVRRVVWEVLDYYQIDYKIEKEKR